MTFIEHSTQRQQNTHFFPSAPRTFIEINYSLSQKTSLNKFKNIQITLNMFSDHCGIKLNVNNRKIFTKFSNIWKLNNALLNAYWSNEELMEN